MKQNLLLFLLLPFAAFSQHIQSDQTDDLEHLRRIATSRIEFNGFTTSLSGSLIIKEQDTTLFLNLFFRAGKPTFTDEKTMVILKLENGETIKVYNQGNRKELTATEPGFILFSLTEREKTRLLATKVVGYSIQTGHATVDVNLDEFKQKAFYNTINLLDFRAKFTASLD